MRYLVLICFMFACPSLVRAQSAARLPRPSEAALGAAKGLVEELYKKDYTAAKTTLQKRALVQRLLDDAAKTNDDPAARFAILQVARKIAIGMGDINLALEVAERVAASYEVTVVSERADIVKAAAPLAKSAADHLSLMPHFQRTIARSTKAQRFREAQELAVLALASAKKTGDPDLVKQWTRGNDQLAAKAKLVEAVLAARKTLESAPADPAANGAVGKVVCFLQEDWNQGLTHLALGDDEQLQMLAEQELKPGADLLELAEGWIKAAAALPDAMQVGALRHAEKLYRTALASSDGLAKRKIEKNIEELLPRTTPFAKDEWVDLLDYVDPARHAINASLRREGDAIVIEEHHDDGYFTIPVTATGAYEIRVRAIRQTPKEEGISLRLPGTRGGFYSLNAYSGMASGLTSLNGKDCNGNASRVAGSPFREREPYFVQVRVEPRAEAVAITTLLNGRKYARWAGPLASIASPDNIAWKTSQFGVDVWWSRLAVESFELKVLEGTAYVTE
jgi:hypothetical protein